MPQIAMRPLNSELALPSFVQQQLWYFSQETNSSFICNNLFSLSFKNIPQIAGLEQSLNEIIRRHAVLRTTFDVVSEELLQIIASNALVDLSVMNLCDLPKDGRQSQIQFVILQELQHIFDLNVGPLLRTSLLHIDDEEYVLLLNAHPIIYDLSSVAIFIRELATLYEAFSQENSSPLSEATIQYSDFARWQRQPLRGRDQKGQYHHWKQLLQYATVLQLPSDNLYPNIPLFRKTRLVSTISRQLFERLETLGNNEETDADKVVLAAFVALLFRYTGQSDFLLRIPLNQRVIGYEGVMGPFTTTGVLHAEVSGNPTFREVLSRVKRAFLEASSTHQPSFAELQREIPSEQNIILPPPFQVAFTPEYTPFIETELPDLFTNVEVISDGAPVALNLGIIPSSSHHIKEEDEIALLWEYSPEVFFASTIDRMKEHLQVLLASVVLSADVRLADIPILTRAEEEQLLVEWNDVESDFPKNLCLHQLFEARVAQDPETIAILSKGKQWTYQELNHRANQVAHRLQRLGVRPEVRVAVCVERSLEVIIGLLGILKAGGAYVPLDPTYPPERLAFMLEDSQAQVLLTQQSLFKISFELFDDMVVLDLDDETIADESFINPTSEVSTENLAYVIYTSGSTGKPKGVAIRHRGIVNNVIDLNNRFHVGKQDRILALSSLGFDMSVYELLGILGSGAAVVLPEASHLRDAKHWIQLMFQFEVTLWSSAPALLNMLLTSAEEHIQIQFKRLRVALLAGDWVPMSMPGRIRELAPDIQVINLGGVTEVSIYSTIHRIDESDAKKKSIPYGRPMINQQVYVLDRSMRPVPIGVPGELYFAGEGLARGYFNCPDLTAEKFIPHPFSQEVGARLYRTGDLVRYQGTGELELLGRIDHQVKIRGLRIELGEIEAIIKQDSSIKEVVVLVREDNPGDRYLVAYIIPKQSISLDFATMRTTLKKTLPVHMVPTSFVQLESLPLLPNGKIDRKAFPRPETGIVLTQPILVPRTPVEEVVVQTWLDILGLDQLSIEDTFFELGGNSLHVLQLHSRLQEFFLIDVPLPAFFDALTVAAQAVLIEKVGAEAQVDIGKIADLVLQLHQLSEADVRQMLKVKDKNI